MTKKMDTIAAIIPLYNKEPYVARAINSILAQSVPVDEIIVVDDASTDGSLERVKTFSDPRIRVLRRLDPKERGLPATRNLGIRSATSLWIALLDADDSWHSHFIEESKKLIAYADDGTRFLFTGWETIAPDGAISRDPCSASHHDQRMRRVSLDAFVSDWLHIGACPVCASGVIIRRDALLDAGLFREDCRRGEDKDMWLRALAITDALSSPRVCTSYYRAIPGAMNENISTNMRHCLCATLEHMIACSSPIRRRLLERLFNREVLEYALWVAGREPLSPEVYRGFFVNADPLGYVLLLALSYLPFPLLQLARRRLLRLSDLTGRRQWASAPPQ